MPTSTPRLVTAVKNYLKENLPADVAAAGLPEITEFLRHSPAYIDPTKAPQVFVSITGIRPTGPAGFGGANAAKTRKRLLLVGVTTAGEDPDTAAEQLEGYADLLLAVMERDQTAGGQGAQVKHTGTDFSPNFGGGTALYQEAILSFEITRWSALGED